MKNRFNKIGNEVIIYLDRKDGTQIETIIDSDDFDKVSNMHGKWVAQWSKLTQSFYVIISRKDIATGKRYRIHLHRLITDCPLGYVPDHINHNTLDNRKNNLMVVTRRENALNPKVPFNENLKLQECIRKLMTYPRNRNRKNKTGFSGVYFDKRTNKWRAMVRKKKKIIFQKYYDNIEDAAKAVEDARNKLLAS